MSDEKLDVPINAASDTSGGELKLSDTTVSTFKEFYYDSDKMSATGVTLSTATRSNDTATLSSTPGYKCVLSKDSITIPVPAGTTEWFEVALDDVTGVGVGLATASLDLDLDPLTTNSVIWELDAGVIVNAAIAGSADNRQKGKNGDTVQLHISGSTLTLYINGTKATSATVAVASGTWYFYVGQYGISIVENVATLKYSNQVQEPLGTHGQYASYEELRVRNLNVGNLNTWKQSYVPITNSPYRVRPSDSGKVFLNATGGDCEVILEDPVDGGVVITFTHAELTGRALTLTSVGKNIHVAGGNGPAVVSDGLDHASITVIYYNDGWWSLSNVGTWTPGGEG
jgi:hypothetical protein